MGTVDRKAVAVAAAAADGADAASAEPVGAASVAAAAAEEQEDNEAVLEASLDTTVFDNLLASSSDPVVHIEKRPCPGRRVQTSRPSWTPNPYSPPVYHAHLSPCPYHL